jgi:thiamine phosphate synthase YjbQ (UPF0047 family)
MNAGATPGGRSACESPTRRPVEELVGRSGIQEGRAAFDPSPQRYAHNRTGEDNADAHLKRQVIGRVVVAISKGRLDFGLWEQICYGESDGRRPKRVPVTLIGR